MTFIYHQTICTRAQLQYKSTYDDSEDISLSEIIWGSLVEDTAAQRVAITIHPEHQWGDYDLDNNIAPFISWCRKDDTVDGVSVPSHWNHTYPTIFSRDNSIRYVLSLTTPVVLDEVILQAQSSEAYHVAMVELNNLHDRLFGLEPIIRLGSACTLTNAGLEPHQPGELMGKLQFGITMTIPALQGCVKKATTRVYVIPPSESLPTNPINLSSLALNPSDGEDFEINEDFLGSSVVPYSIHTVHDATPIPSSKHLPGEKKVTRLDWICSVCPSSIGNGDDCTIYVRTSDLSRIGVLDGEWAIARSAAKFTYRLVYVKANDTLLQNSGTIFASAPLFHNFFGGVTAHPPRLSLMPSSFGSRRPPIPTARSVTIARLASPLSTDRTYQPLFLRKLHTYFQGKPRLMKQGDIIAIGFDTDGVRGTEQSEGLQYIPAAFRTGAYEQIVGHSHEKAYFIVTNLEHGVVQNQDIASVPDSYSGATTGELGCWVNPEVTRIVQSGLEQGRVPNDSETSLSTWNLATQEPAFKSLFALLSAALARDAAEYRLQLSILLRGSRGIGKMFTTAAVARQLGIGVLEVNCFELLGENGIQTEGTLRSRCEKAVSCAPCVLILRHVDALGQSTQAPEPGKAPSIADVLAECIGDLQDSWGLSRQPVIVVATTDRAEQMFPRISSCFKHEIDFGAPEEERRQEILRSILDSAPLSPDVSVKETAVQTAALVASDLVDLVSRAKHIHAKHVIHDSNRAASDLEIGGSVLAASDFEHALNQARLSYAESIGAPKIPSVKWDDVGGLANVKADILDTIQLPLEHPELFAGGLKKRSGILLYGPPGTGKTLLAKAVATSCALNFFSVKGPELLNMYIGESEANVRRVFQRARDAKPCVIFFDELDSVAPKRGNQGDSGGVMDRIVSQLLAELDGVSAGESGADVFVIGATNRPDLLDPALLRPGRFDRMLYLGVSQTHEAQLNILQALTRKFKLHPDLGLQKVAEACPFHYTGADFYALCSDALLKAMTRKAEELELKIATLNNMPIDSKHPYPLTPQYYLAEMASAEDIEVLVSQNDFDSALRDLVPSVSQAEMEHYARVQQQFSNETINKT